MASETQPQARNEFKPFAQAVRKRFDEMTATGALFCVSSFRDEMWLKYLYAFPDGSNRIYRTRQEHDCSCCRHFIYNTGNVVAIQNGAISSIWDLNGLPEPYQTVADAMAAYVRGLPIRDVFYTKMRSHGQLMSRAFIDNNVVQFNHFSADIPTEFVHQDVATRKGEDRTAFAVLVRGLTEIKPEALSVVLDLIEQNNLYRGADFKRQIVEFSALQARYLEIQDERNREIFAWSEVKGSGASVTHLRNTAIGTLLQDLSADTDLEVAVRKYEVVVAPENYKRSTALISKAQVEQAMATIQELNLEPALERRHARYSDVPITSVLFVDNAVRAKLKGGIESLLMSEAKHVSPSAATKGAQEVPVDIFMSSILPKTQTVQLRLDNELLPNFMSLTAPVHEDAQPLFKWNNGFAWSYDGNVTDSIKERVKRAGGRVEGVAMRVSLAWFKTDDFDLHCTDSRGHHIFYGNKEDILDVDMNYLKLVNDPVENMRWVKSLEDGVYRFWVNNFTHRESINAGFEIEIEGNGLSGVQSLSYEKDIPHNGDVQVAEIVVHDGKIQEVRPGSSMIVGAAQREHWGLKTLDLVRVNSIILSPNYWERSDSGVSRSGVGNKHWFFILDGCTNPLPIRGIYNEFLRYDLEKHRKVFEVLGDKTKCPVAREQMSGVGFSSTLRAKALVLANNRPYTICF